MDILSSIIFELATHADGTSKPDTPSIVHAVNTRKSKWRDTLLPVVLKHLNSRGGVQPTKVVRLSEWVKALQEAAEGDMSTNPDGTEHVLGAVKLLPFYKGLLKEGSGPVFETARAAALSPTLRELPAVDGEWAARWLQQWGYATS